MTTPCRTPYHYTVLRYVHDVATGEFVNVGVVLTGADDARVAAKFRRTYTRLKSVFPNLDGEAFRGRMRQLQHTFDRLASGDLALPPRAERATLAHYTNSVIPVDDSSLQWAPPGSGLSVDLQATLQTLYQRFVAQHDSDGLSERRKDDDVWHNFKRQLEQRNVLRHLDEKVISVADDAVRFKHAWKNGAWHCYEPLSFDLASDSSIKEKAHKWLGQMASLRGAPDPFQVYFLVGKPTDLNLHDAYYKALSILRKDELSTVVEESAAEPFSEQVATDILAHIAQQLLTESETIARS